MLLTGDVELPVAGPGLNGERREDEGKYLQIGPPCQVVTVHDMEISEAAAEEGKGAPQRKR